MFTSTNTDPRLRPCPPNRSQPWAALAVVLAVVLLAACTRVSPDAAWDEIRTASAKHSDATLPAFGEVRATAEGAGAIRVLLAEELTAASAIQIAFLNNRSVRALYRRLGVAQADLVQAGLLRNPLFEAAVRFPTSGGGSADLDFGLVQDLVDLVLIPVRRERAGAEFAAAKIEIQRALLSLAAETRRAFHEAQAAAELHSLREHIREAVGASLEVTRQLHTAGNITDLALLREQALAEEANLDTAAAEARLHAARERLTVLLGLTGDDTAWRIAPRLPEVPLEPPSDADIERQAIVASLDLAILRHRIDARSVELGIARATALVSDAEVGISAERSDREWSVGPTAAVSVPIFDVGGARIASADARFHQLIDEYEATAVALRSAARLAYGRLLFAWEGARHQMTVVLPLRHQIVEQTMLQYNAMQVGAGDLIAARADEIRAGGRLVETTLEYWLARADYEQLLHGSLSPASRSTAGHESMATSDGAMTGAGGH